MLRTRTYKAAFYWSDSVNVPEGFIEDKPSGYALRFITLQIKEVRVYFYEILSMIMYIKKFKLSKNAIRCIIEKEVNPICPFLSENREKGTNKNSYNPHRPPYPNLSIILI